MSTPRGDVNFQRLHEQADRAGQIAAIDAVQRPVMVVQHAAADDPASPVVSAYGPYFDLPMGNAWVLVRSGTSAFARWARRHLQAEPGRLYGARRGVVIRVEGFGPSLVRRFAYATAYAAALRGSEIDAAPVRHERGRLVSSPPA